MEQQDIEILTGATSLMIVPGYEFKATDTLITNFHIPRSTLLMLVAAFVGDDWKKIYNYAICNGFRFLSYGDSSLLNGNKNM
jgi:S-adenosylmethionine:tRNA ribosyltransferase-isomerase